MRKNKDGSHSMRLDRSFYEVRSSRIPKHFHGAVVALIADVHNCLLGPEHETLMDALRSVGPDYVMAAGDMIVGSEKCSRENALLLFEKLTDAGYPVYYGMGNHELKMEERSGPAKEMFRDFLNQCRQLGIRLLINESVMLRRGEDEIQVTGVQIGPEYYERLKKIQMDPSYLNRLAGIPKDGVYQILLAHNPVFHTAYAQWGADLILSGHMHGGLFRLPLIGGVISPQYIPFPKYDYGRFQEGKSTLILSRGLGSHTMSLRFLHNNPEVVFIRLIRECENGTVRKKPDRNEAAKWQYR
ncbi:metallophosphoesterase [Anaerolentibacter hominis]|uniref:metallophosphoesterase n=1 Tax=Anaerolentibacter hominis TaxID=3079009 RepID=UPI0031B83016